MAISHDKGSSRRSIDWRDSGIVIDDEEDSTFGAICDIENTATHSFTQDDRQKYHDEDGDTILHLAVVGCSYNIVNDLLQVCDLNAINNMMQTPLHVATLANREEMVSLLLRENANPHVRDRRGNTPLQLACNKGFLEVTDTILTALNNFGGKGNVQEHTKLANFDGQTCVHLAAVSNHRNILELLVNKYNVDMNYQDSKSGETILHKAVRQFNVELVSFICQLVSHCNKPDYSDKKPLACVHEMFESSLDINQIDKLNQIKSIIELRIKQCIEIRSGCCTEADLASVTMETSSSEDEEDYDF